MLVIWKQVVWIGRLRLYWFKVHHVAEGTFIPESPVFTSQVPDFRTILYQIIEQYFSYLEL